MLELLAADEGGASGGGGLGGLMLPLLIIWGIWWFLVLRPQRAQEKQRQERLKSVSKGDTVRMRGGIIGRVKTIRDEQLVLQTGTDGKSTVTVALSAVEDVQGKDDAKAEKA